MSFLPYIAILMIVLAVHELGHLVSARIFDIRASRMQLGIGPTLLTCYTGRTRFRIHHSLTPPPAGARIEFMARYEGEGQPMTILAWQPHITMWSRLAKRRQRHGGPAGKSILTKPPERAIAFNGRVRSTPEGEAIISTMAWALAPIPLAAYVSLPEALNNDVPRCYNTTTWRIKTLIAATGVIANIALFVAVTLALPFIHNPYQGPQQERQKDEIPAYHQRVADTTLRYYNGFRAATEAIINSRETPEHYPDQFSQAPTICGPLCASQVTGAAVEVAGLYGWVAVLGIVTIFTAALNLLPVPPLDGWKIALNTAQAIRRKPFNPATTMSIEVAAVAFIALIVLFLILSDIRHLF